MSKQRKLFITGIGTDVGKTVVSAILAEALKADYWKPVQAGSLDNTDSDVVRRIISNSVSVVHPEAYRLTQPMSPHAAAKIDGITIRLKDFKLPDTQNTLIIEGAGGILVPLSDNKLVIDLIEKLKAEVVIVISNYLGSINHSLLTIECALNRKLAIAGIIFNGEPNVASEEIILHYAKLRLLGRIQQEHEVSREMVLKYAGQFSSI